MRYLLPKLLLAITLACALNASETTGIIVNDNLPLGELTRERVIDLVTGRVVSLTGDQRVVLVLSYGPAGQAAVQDLAARDVARLLRGWKRLVFGTGGSLPLTAADDRAAYELITRVPGGVLPSTRPATALPAGLRFVPLPAP